MIPKNWRFPAKMGGLESLYSIYMYYGIIIQDRLIVWDEGFPLEQKIVQGGKYKSLNKCDMIITLTT